VKKIIQKISHWTLGIALLGCAITPARAFNAMYVFGDALSTTTNNSFAATYPKQYYGNRYSNGRLWVEVLAQRQGVPVNMNWSYFDCNSAKLWTNTQNFSITQQAASNALAVVWCNNSDLYDLSQQFNTNIVYWTTNIMRAQTNEFRAITNLYAKGFRTIIAPGAVDLSEVPAFCYSAGYQSNFLKFLRQQCSAYNTNFVSTLNRARAACPGLTIYEPNFFGLLDNVLTNAASYGLTNALAANGMPIDAFDALYPNCSTNGLGANYVYWDNLDPSAKFHEIIGDTVQQLISPVQIARITTLNSSNQLDVINVPLGLNGFVETCTNLSSPNWTQLQSISGASGAQSYFVPLPPNGTGSQQHFAPRDITPPGPGGTVNVTALAFYRMNYPYQWVWP